MASTPADPAWKAVVDAVRKYYTFLAADLGGIPSHSILEPPASGWRTVTEDSLAGLGKTTAVIDILRHLPYIKHDPDRCTQIAFATRAADYRNMQIAVGERPKYFPHGSTEFPAHVAVLSYNEEGSGSWLLFDTERGTITDYLPEEPIKQGAPDPESPDFWRSFETLPPAEFFAVWEQRFRSLEWTVNPFSVDDGMMVRWDRGTDEVRQIYRDHGWPDNFRREACHRTLADWDKTYLERLLALGSGLGEITRTPPGLHDRGRTDANAQGHQDDKQS